MESDFSSGWSITTASFSAGGGGGGGGGRAGGVSSSPRHGSYFEVLVIRISPVRPPLPCSLLAIGCRALEDIIDPFYGHDVPRQHGGPWRQSFEDLEQSRSAIDPSLSSGHGLYHISGVFSDVATQQHSGRGCIADDGRARLAEKHEQCYRSIIRWCFCTADSANM